MCFRWRAFITDYISTSKSEVAFMGLDLEADKLRINAELRVMMAVTKIKMNQTQTNITRHILSLQTGTKRFMQLKIKIVPVNRGNWLTGL